eukprot:363869-Chlamydomonas_euryale.AAC.3
MYTHGVQFGTVWEVPQTLRELAAFASKYNGTDNKWALCLPWCDSRSYFGYLYKTFIASYVQIDGTTQVRAGHVLQHACVEVGSQGPGYNVAGVTYGYGTTVGGVASLSYQL